MDAQPTFIAAAREALARFPLDPLNSDEAPSHIKAPGGEIRVERYSAIGFEKIVLCAIELAANSLVESSLLAWPAPGHSMPILWCNLTRVPGVMNVAIFDFLPVTDPVLWPECSKHLEGLRDLKTNTLARFGDSVIDKAVMLPSRAIYALSPYSLVVNLSEDGLPHLTEVLGDYLRTYHALWSQAVPLEDPVQRQQSICRLDAIRALMKANDPGYSFMVDVFGEATTRRVFDAVF